MLSWGTRTKAVVIAMLTLVCNACGNPAAHQVLKRQTRFTLFFVPLFPIRTRHMTQCTFCGTVVDVSKEQATELIASGQPAPEVAPPTAAPAPERQDESA